MGPLQYVSLVPGADMGYGKTRTQESMVYIVPSRDTLARLAHLDSTKFILQSINDRMVVRTFISLFL